MLLYEILHVYKYMFKLKNRNRDCFQMKHLFYFYKKIVLNFVDKNNKCTVHWRGLSVFFLTNTTSIGFDSNLKVHLDLCSNLLSLSEENLTYSNTHMMRYLAIYSK